MTDDKKNIQPKQKPDHPQPTHQPKHEEKAKNNEGGRTPDWLQQERPDKKKCLGMMEIITTSPAG